MKINNKDATAYSNKELSHIIKKVLGEKIRLIWAIF